MIKNIDSWNDIDASVSVACFAPEGKVGEAHAIVQVEANDDLFSDQLERLLEAERRILQRPHMRGMKAVFKRYFLSDAVNQAPLVPADTEPCSVSFIQQTPLNGSKIALWVYYITTDDVTRQGQFTVVSHNGYKHLWCMGMTSDEGDSYQQTETLLQRYEDGLSAFGANIAENCLRTWFFVRDVDIQYKGLVDARRDYFNRIGLRADTHYLASTGICGTSASRKAIHQLGTYAATGLEKDQVRYLQAASHMNRTSDYGVTFERATEILFGDRNHILVSGTASIDNRGQVVHAGDVRKQTERMWENVETLLNEGQQTWDDVMQIIVYLRDVADAQMAKEMFTEKFPDTPFVITLAPVCRPEWLIEMECIAVKTARNDYPDF